MVNKVTVTAFNKARSAAIEALAVVGATVVGDNLVMTRNNGNTFIAGNVRGPKGDTGAPGSLTGPAGGDLTGNYPDPTVGLLKVTTGKIADGAVTAVKTPYNIATKAPGDLPSTYPDGITHMDATGQTTYPAGEFSSVITYKRTGNSRTVQYNINKAGDLVYVRGMGTGDVWTAWKKQLDADDSTGGSTTPEAWTVVGSGGSAPAFQGTWAEASGNATTKFRKSGSYVDLSIAAAGSGGGNADPIFILPAGYRPAEDLRGVIAFQGGSTVPATFDITTTGEVRFFRQGGPNPATLVLLVTSIPLG